MGETSVLVAGTDGTSSERGVVGSISSKFWVFALFQRFLVLDAHSSVLSLVWGVLLTSSSGSCCFTSSVGTEVP